MHTIQWNQFYEWNELYIGLRKSFQMHISIALIQERRSNGSVGEAVIELREL